MSAELKTSHGDHAHLIAEILDEVQPRPIVRQVITAAYAAGYERQSDGITLMPELAFASLKMKHPAGVGHDWLYYMGCANPFLPARRLVHRSFWSEGGSLVGEDGRARRSLLGEDGQARLWADNWFSDALKDFGHPIRARLWWLALRIGGWRAWNKHRNKNHPLSKAAFL
ncbi:MAG: hypothetical protein ABIH24_10220 [Verrucomicrobiota bacterium]